MRIWWKWTVVLPIFPWRPRDWHLTGNSLSWGILWGHCCNIKCGKASQDKIALQLRSLQQQQREEDKQDRGIVPKVGFSRYLLFCTKLSFWKVCQERTWYGNILILDVLMILQLIASENWTINQRIPVVVGWSQFFKKCNTAVLRLYCIWMMYIDIK